MSIYFRGLIWLIAVAVGVFLLFGRGLTSEVAYYFIIISVVVTADILVFWRTRK